MNVKRIALMLFMTAAGVAASLVITTRPASAWTAQDLPSLGYSVHVTSLGNNCNDWQVSRPPTPAQLGTDLGSDCDPGFQARLDAYVEATCPCAQTTAATSTSAPPSSTATSSTTTTATTTAASPPPPPPPSTTTVAAPANQPPSADFAAAFAAATGSFSASATDDGPVGSFVWSFGDGANGTGQSIDHVYPAGGNYVVILTVVDAGGLSVQVARTVHVDPAGASTVGALRVLAAGQTLNAPARCNAGAFADHACTPGAIVAGVTRAQVCARGWAAGRPRVSPAQRQRVAAAYGLSSVAGYELDRLVPVGLGGSNADVNVWPQPLRGAAVKDRRESALQRAVCAGKRTLGSAQAELRGWSR